MSKNWSPFPVSLLSINLRDDTLPSEIESSGYITDNTPYAICHAPYAIYHTLYEVTTMSNPFTRFLRSLRPNTLDIEIFVAWWDVVEAIVVDVNKRGYATDEERAAYAEARQLLLTNYQQHWAPRFAPHWIETLEGGKTPPSDPFPRLLAPQSADGFINNWSSMQALPAARETLNRYILAL